MQEATQEPQEVAPIPGYGLQEIYWEAVLGPNGPTIRHLGTWEEFLDKIVEADPDADISGLLGGHAGRMRAPPDVVCPPVLDRYRNDDNITDYDGPYDASNRADASGDSGSRLKMKRDSPYYCFNYPLTKYGAIEDGIDYLRHVPFQPTNGPGPGNCGRVSCSWNAAIWWCNDVSSPFMPLSQ